MRIRKALAVSASFAVLFTACSVAHAALPTACQLLDAQTAARLAGGAVATTVDGREILCAYGLKSGNANVLLQVNYAPGTDGSDTIPAMRMAAGQVGTAESIPGLGDHNLLYTKGSQGSFFLVYYHQKMLQLSVGRQLTPDLKAAMVQAIRQMLSKL